MSKDQEKTARRLANIPESEFDAAVESDNPPTVTQLAEMGREKQENTAPPGFALATHLIGATGRLAEFFQEHKPASIASGLMEGELEGLHEKMTVIRTWIDDFLNQTKEQTDG